MNQQEQSSKETMIQNYSRIFQSVSSTKIADVHTKSFHTPTILYN